MKFGPQIIYMSVLVVLMSFFRLQDTSPTRSLFLQISSTTSPKIVFIWFWTFLPAHLAIISRGNCVYLQKKIISLIMSIQTFLYITKTKYCNWFILSFMIFCVEKYSGKNKSRELSILADVGWVHSTGYKLYTKCFKTGKFMVWRQKS